MLTRQFSRLCGQTTAESIEWFLDGQVLYGMAPCQSYLSHLSLAVGVAFSCRFKYVSGGPVARLGFGEKRPARVWGGSWPAAGYRSVVQLSPGPTRSPSASCLSFSVFLSVAGRAYWRESGVRGWGGSKSYDRKKAWPFVNHSILSGLQVSCVHSAVYTVQYLSPRISTPWMKEVRDNTWRVGGLPTLPGLYLSTFQPSQRGFFSKHLGVWRGREPEP